ncbi:MAG: dihydrofolate reductase family protein [Streptosporangiaceae bacterium]
MQRGLVDEILVHILPVLLGGGTPFFTSAEAARIDLEPISSARSGLVTTLRFGVRK